MPVKIDDYLQFGKLVKSWTTRENYFARDSSNPFPGGAPPLPMTMAELKEQCRVAGVGLTVPADITGLQFIQHTSNTLIIKLPPPDLVKKSESDISLTPAAYPLPDFYDEFYRASAPPKTQQEKLEFHARRTADYTFGQCG
jgi:hypothetical protein